ncbi:putative transporter [Pseudoloma neurophilia]|uniref:Putative transporter n=1 Tax=Pseudoloma neurophilia TaxID=146866 RepID=A0A0R0LX47_9MICR|nr:putative transporter [Pseudoloma neurophilia]
MAKFKITTNKILFVISLFLDIFFCYFYWSDKRLFYYIFIPIFIIILSYLKLFHFRVCFTYINRKNVNIALLSNIWSLLFRLYFVSLFFLTWSFDNLLWNFLFSLLFFVDFCINIYFIFTIYFMKSLLYFNINIPVDGWGIAEKVDAIGDAIPGL